MAEFRNLLLQFLEVLERQEQDAILPDIHQLFEEVEAPEWEGKLPHTITYNDAYVDLGIPIFDGYNMPLEEWLEYYLIALDEKKIFDSSSRVIKASGCLSGEAYIWFLDMEIAQKVGQGTYNLDMFRDDICDRFGRDSRDDDTNNRVLLGEEQQPKVAPEFEVVCELLVQTVNALKVFDEIPPRSCSDSGLVNDVLNKYEVPTRQSYDPGIEVEVAAWFDDDNDLSWFGLENEELEDLDMDKKVKLVEEAKVSRDANNEFHFYGHQDTAMVEVTPSIVLLIDSFNLCLDHLLSSQIVAKLARGGVCFAGNPWFQFHLCTKNVVVWYYQRVTWPTGIGTILRKFRLLVCGKFLLRGRDNEAILMRVEFFTTFAQILSDLDGRNSVLTADLYMMGFKILIVTISIKIETLALGMIIVTVVIIVENFWNNELDIEREIGNQLNVGSLKPVKEEFVLVHRVLELKIFYNYVNSLVLNLSSHLQWDLGECWSYVHHFFIRKMMSYGRGHRKWVRLKYHNLGDKVDFQEFDNRGDAMLHENRHILSYIEDGRNGDDKKSVSLNCRGVEGMLMFSKSEAGVNVSLPEGKTVAAKKLSQAKTQGHREFLAEMETLGKVHQNLVPLLRCCFMDDEKLLVYEYMVNGSLDMWLVFGHDMGAYDVTLVLRLLKLFVHSDGIFAQRMKKVATWTAALRFNHLLGFKVRFG